MDAVFPPGLSEATLNRALKAFATIVGADAVFATAEDRDTYADKYAINDARHHASAAVAPATAAQVQAIVRIANEYKVPLWPISRGKNLGYGYAAPALTGSVVVDLSRMKRIEVDVENGTVLIEPGVGFYDLYDYVQAHKLPFWLSVPGNSWGSVIGNALDRGVGYTPYGEHTARLCGMEVVLPDGDLVRTGMGAMSNSRSWGLYRYGFGPAWDQMFVQSNLGIVTKANLWLMPEPEQVRGMDIEMDAVDDLAPLIDAIGALRREGVLQQSPTIGNWLRAANIVSTRDQWVKDGAPLTDATIAAIRQKFGLGWWGVSLRLYGREAITNAAYPILERAMQAIKPMSLKPTMWRKGDPIAGNQGGWMGVPMTFPMQNSNWYGGRGGHIGFSPVMPQSGRLALEQFKRNYARYREYGFDPQMSFQFGERNLINVNAILLNKDDPAFMAKVDPFIRAMVADSAAHGYAEYRAHLDYMDTIAATYDFNNHALLRLNEKIKTALDPNGILAPGKSGIWPRTYAQERGK